MATDSARHCNADQAFEILVELSSKSHRKLRDVAQTVVEETTSTLSRFPKAERGL